jgi:hypothetical protein
MLKESSSQSSEHSCQKEICTEVVGRIVYFPITQATSNTSVFLVSHEHVYKATVQQ